jgi:hypothetical protein
MSVRAIRQTVDKSGHFCFSGVRFQRVCPADEAPSATILREGSTLINNCGRFLDLLYHFGDIGRVRHVAVKAFLQ